MTVETALLSVGGVLILGLLALVGALLNRELTRVTRTLDNVLERLEALTRTVDLFKEKEHEERLLKLEEQVGTLRQFRTWVREKLRGVVDVSEDSED